MLLFRAEPELPDAEPLPREPVLLADVLFRAVLPLDPCLLLADELFLPVVPAIVIDFKLTGLIYRPCFLIARVKKSLAHDIRNAARHALSQKRACTGRITIIT